MNSNELSMVLGQRNDQSIMMGHLQRNELSLLSQEFVPIDRANLIGNAEDEESKDDESSVPQPTLRTTTIRQTDQTMVLASDLRNYVKSKEDLYVILSIEGQFHLPPYDECTMEFMRDALSGRKRLITNRELAPVTVPRYREFNAAGLQKAALADDELRLCLPDASEKTINRKFLFNVSASLTNVVARSSTP